MTGTKADIIAQLRKEILPLQGIRPAPGSSVPDFGLGIVNQAFPNQQFPTGAIHEFFCHSPENLAATSGFLSAIVSTLMRRGGVSFWISSIRTVFPPALKFFGIDPDRIIFIDLKKDRDVLWAMEEALQCDALAAVIGETRDISFIGSRRLQLAVEKSRVTGFLILHDPRQLTTACVTRWKISPLPSKQVNHLPGIGFSKWKVDLLRVRNGHPGTWELEWAAGKFRHPLRPVRAIEEQQRKTG